MPRQVTICMICSKVFQQWGVSNKPALQLKFIPAKKSTPRVGRQALTFRQNLKQARYLCNIFCILYVDAYRNKTRHLLSATMNHREREKIFQREQKILKNSAGSFIEIISAQSVENIFSGAFLILRLID